MLIDNNTFEQAWNDIDNRNIINKAAKKYLKTIDQEELESCMMEGLWKCLKTFDKSKGIKFTTYLYNSVQWACGNYVKQTYDDTCYIPDLENLSMAPSGTSMLEMQDCIDKLKPEDAELLNQRFIQNMKYREMGEENGYSKSYAQQKTKKAVASLKKMYLHE